LISRTTPRAPLIILGMHRSGTSCLAGSLQQAGLVLGDVHTANPHNRKGNREHPELMALHEELLQASGGSWHQPPAQVHWTPEFSARRAAFCKRFSGVELWGFKDPRALLALDGWLQACPGARMVGSIRHPLAVADSLYRRDPHLCAREDYLALWAAYNRRLLAYWQRYRFPIVDFDLDDAAYQASLERTLTRLGLRQGWWQRLRRGGPAALWRNDGLFFDPALRSQRRQGSDGLPAEIAELYRQLKQVAAR